MNPLLQVLIGLVPLGVAAFATYAAVKANRVTAQVEQQKVDAAAYGRAQKIYESTLAHQEKRIEQLERQLDLVQRENDQQRRQMEDMRAKLAAAGLKDT